MTVLVDLERISARTADRTLFEELSLTVSDGDRIGVVGINGTGKSTLLRVIAGVQQPEVGDVRRGQGVRIGYLEQEPVFGPGFVEDVVGGGWESRAVLERLGMRAELSTDLSALSGGQTKRVALARVLAQPSELLILDEPTNYLDISAITWLERYMSAFRGGLVLVSHDRHLLDRVTTRMLELDRGHRYLHDGGYSSYLTARAEREDQAASAEVIRRNLARRELAWLRRGAPARTRKPQARLDAAARILEVRPEAAARASELGLRLGTPRLGELVIECSQVAYRFTPGDQLLFSGIDLALDPRERLGIVGGNGTGKSTLLDLLAGRREPSAGIVNVGATVVTGYYDQRGTNLDPQARLQDLVAGPYRPAGSPEDVALMERFWFTGELPFAPVGTLSGGERRRLQLLLALAGRPNLLLLDEPTNDLDLDTLRILEEFFEDWPGALVVVSHDRTFLERTIERVVGFNDGGTLKAYAGGVSSWVEEASREPHNAKHSEAHGSRKQRGPGRSGRSQSTISRRLYETDKELDRLRHQCDALSRELGETVERAELARVGSALAEAQASLEEAENRWLLLAEELEGR